MIHEQEYFVHCLNAKLAYLITSGNVDDNSKSSHTIYVNDSALTSSSNSDTETNVTNTSVDLSEDFQCLMYDSFPFSCDTLDPNIVEVEFNGAKSNTQQVKRRNNKVNIMKKVRITPVTSYEDTSSDAESDFNTTTSSLSIPDTNEFLPFLDWTDAITI